jgi:hypothetical protein
MTSAHDQGMIKLSLAGMLILAFAALIAMLAQMG